MSHITFLSLGSNLGSRRQNLMNAIEALRDLGTVQKVSSFWKTKAWGKTDQDDFLNMAVQVQTELSPLEFLQRSQVIEHELGRMRMEKWGPRVIDIDLILWDSEIISMEGTHRGAFLQIPHPYAHQRAFVLAPLLEIAPKIVFPDGISARDFWERLSSEEKEGVWKV